MTVELENQSKQEDWRRNSDDSILMIGSNTKKDNNRIVRFLILSLVILFIAGTITGLLSWYEKPVKLNLFLITNDIRDNRNPYWSMTQGNVRYLKESDLFHTYINLNEQLLNSDLHKSRENGSNLVYIDCLISIDEHNELLLKCDSAKNKFQSSMKFNDVLKWIDKNLNNNTILIFNGFLSNDTHSFYNQDDKVKHLVYKGLCSINKNNLLFILGNEYIRPDVILPGKDHGLFLHFLVEGMKGAADSFSGFEDGTINSSGLVKYLNVRINNWLNHFGFDSHDIIYWASSEDTFTIRSFGVPINEDFALFNQIESYPKWLTNSWKEIELSKSHKNYIDHPLFYHETLQAVQNSEDLWIYGYDRNELKSNIETKLRNANEKYSNSAIKSSLDNFTFAQYMQKGSNSFQFQKLVNDIVEMIKNNRIIASDKNLKSEMQTSKINELVEMWFNSLPKDSSIYFQNATLIQACLNEKWSNLIDIMFINKCLRRIGGPVMLESELIKHFEKLVAESENSYECEVYYEIFKSRCLRENIISQSEIWPKCISVYRKLLEYQHELEIFVLFGGQGHSKAILNEIMRINSELDSIKSNLIMLRNARDFLSFTIQDVYWYSFIYELDPERMNLVIDYFKCQVKLAKSLNDFDDLTWEVEQNQENNKARSTQLNVLRLNYQNEINSMHLTHERLLSARESLLCNFNDSISSILKNEMNTNNLNTKVHVSRIFNLLRLPFISPDIRESLWNQLVSYLILKSKYIDNLKSDYCNSRPLHLNNFSNTYNSPSDNNDHVSLSIKLLDILLGLNGSLSSKNPDNLQVNQLVELNQIFQENKEIKYPIEIVKIPGFSELLDQLFFNNKLIIDDQPKLSNNHINKYNFFSEIRSIRYQFSFDFPSNSIEHQISNYFIESDNTEYRTFPQVTSNVYNVRILSENQKTGKADLKLSFVLDKNVSSVEPFKIELLNHVGSLMVYQCEDKNSKNSEDSPGSSPLEFQKDISFSLNYSLFTELNNVSVLSSEQIIPFLLTYNGLRKHIFVPIRINWKSSLPTIEFHNVPITSSSHTDLRFRPIHKLNSLPVLLTNRTSKIQHYKVQTIFTLIDGTSTIKYHSDEIKIDPNSKLLINLKEKGNEIIDQSTVISTDNLITKKTEQQNSWPGSQIPVRPEFQLQIFDSNTVSGDPIVSESRRMSFLNPREYFNTGMPDYDPLEKKLSISLSGDKDIFDKQPATIRLHLDRTFNDDTMKSKKGGKLDGLFDFRSDSTIKLLAQPVSPPFFDNGLVSRFWIDLDNHKRSFIFQNRWSKNFSDSVTPLPVIIPEIKLIMPEVAGTKKPVPIRIEPINDAENSSVILEIATNQSVGPFQTLNYRTLHKFNSSRKALFAVGVDGKSGSLIVNTDFDDWIYDLQTTGLFGNVYLRARLLDEFGNALAIFEKKILIDDQLPENNNLINLPAFAKPGSSFDIVFTSTQPPSGIAEVIAFPGTLIDGKVTDGVRTSILNPVPSKSGIEKETTANSVLTYYKGKIQIPEKTQAPGETLITVVAKTKAGESVSIQRPIRIVAADYSDPGSISGIVLLADRPQPELPVVLRKMDKNRSEVGRTKTDSQGRFKFNSILPGNYGIFTARSIDQTSAQADLNVEPGNNTELKLVLGRVNLPSNGPPPQEKNEPVETKNK